MSKPVKKMKPYTARWEKEANALARDWTTIIACADCGYPVVKNYRCTHCGSTDPQRPTESQEET